MFDEGSVWPIHLPPLEDEIASSWLMRNAIANGQHFWTFAYYSVGSHGMWNRDMDSRILKKYQKALAYKLKQPESVIFNTTLFSYAPNLYPGSGINKQMKWVMPLGINVKAKHFGMQFCPCCLKEDQQPYYRKYWRLAFMVTCPKHGVWLHDRCPACAAPVLHKKIKPAQNDVYGVEDIARCHHCGFDLRHAFASEADANMVKLNQEQMQLLKCGHGMIGETCHAVASEYFHGLHARVGLVLKTNLKRNTSSLAYELLTTHQVKKMEIEFLSVKDRAWLLPCMV
jgi:hypothetical protein